MHSNIESLKIGYLASHNGSSMRAIIEALTEESSLPVEAAVIISNNSRSKAIEYGQKQNIPTYHLSKKTEGSAQDLDIAIVAALAKHAVDFIILSGWMVLLGPEVTEAYKGRILNSHPALFSSPYKGKGFYGDHVHHAVLAAGEKTSGVTIHLVDAEYDHGEVIAEEPVAVVNEDTVETLRARVQAKERTLYIEVIRKILQGEVELKGLRKLL